MEETTKVVFRAWRNTGDVLALFPEVPADNDGDLCSSFEHLGQHGGADTAVVLSRTRPVGKGDAPAVTELARELRERGYGLDVRRRVTRRMHDARRAESERSRVPARGRG